MTVFGADVWTQARSDAFDTEAEALAKAAETLNAVSMIGDHLECARILDTANTLLRMADKRRKAAAELRAAA